MATTSKKLSLRNLMKTKKIKNNEKEKSNIYSKISIDPIKVLDKMTTDDITILIKKLSSEYYKGTPLITDDIFDIIAFIYVIFYFFK